MDSKGMDSRELASWVRNTWFRSRQTMGSNQSGRTNSRTWIDHIFQTVDPNAMKFLQELTYMLKNVHTKFQLNWMDS